MDPYTGHYCYDNIEIGTEESFCIEITPQMMEQFFSITGDGNPLHMNPVYAKEHGFDRPAVYGMLTASFLSTLAGMYLPGERSLIHSIDIVFPAPVFVGEILTVKGTVSEKNDLFKTIKLKVSICNQSNRKVCRGTMQIGVRE